MEGGSSCRCFLLESEFVEVGDSFESLESDLIKSGSSLGSCTSESVLTSQECSTAKGNESLVSVTDSECSSSGLRCSTSGKGSTSVVSGSLNCQFSEVCLSLKVGLSSNGSLAFLPLSSGSSLGGLLSEVSLSSSVSGSSKCSCSLPGILDFHCSSFGKEGDTSSGGNSCI